MERQPRSEMYAQLAALQVGGCVSINRPMKVMRAYTYTFRKLRKCMEKRFIVRRHPQNEHWSRVWRLK
jgi:hypothetical protein